MRKHTRAGFTLIEMLLVLAIISSLTVMLVNYTTQKFNQFRRDKLALQMQQILNAGLAYYASTGLWPITGASSVLGACPSSTSEGEVLLPAQTLQAANYLPSGVTFNNPWGQPYLLNCNTTNGVNFFTVTTDAKTTQDAAVVAGSLPLAYVTGTNVTAQVTVPGANLNNARSLNFAGIYHTGGCVPVPTCPGNMVPDIIVIPASVSGVNNPPTGCSGGTCSSIQVFSIASFTASTTPAAEIKSGTGPASCDGSSDSAPCYSDVGSPWTTITSGKYWRVCLTVFTDQGLVNLGAPNTGSGTDSKIFWAAAEGSIIATTRCVPQNEAVGSSVNVWGN